MHAVKVLIMVLTMTLAAEVGVKGRHRGTNNRRRRHRYNPYAVPTLTEYTVEDYDEVEVSSYCRESVAHHENYVRTMTQAPNISSKVVILTCFELFALRRCS